MRRALRPIDLESRSETTRPWRWYASLSLNLWTGETELLLFDTPSRYMKKRDNSSSKGVVLGQSKLTTSTLVNGSTVDLSYKFRF